MDPPKKVFICFPARLEFEDFLNKNLSVDTSGDFSFFMFSGPGGVWRFLNLSRKKSLSKTPGPLCGDSDFLCFPARLEFGDF